MLTCVVTVPPPLEINEEGERAIVKSGAGMLIVYVAEATELAVSPGAIATARMVTVESTSRELPAG
jgi:hypothetical protein